MIQVINTNNKSQYIESLDSLRGLAVLVVLLFHGSYGLFAGGWIGVDLFFVLSGYLITSLLQNEYLTSGNISLSKFYARRALRLLPPLIIGVLIANILWPFTNLPGGNQLVASIAAIFYSTNLISDVVAGNMSHLWSLSVEEHFYFIWPVVVLFFVFRISLRNRILFLIILIFSLAVFRIFTYNFINYLTYGVFIIDAYQLTPCRIDSILMGALLFFILSKPQFNGVSLENTSKGNLFIVILLCAFFIIMLTVSIRNTYWYNGGFIVTNLLCTFIVWFAIKNPYHYLFSNKILRWVGKRSYGIYVYHFPIFVAFEAFRVHHSISNFLIVSLLRFIVSLGLAALSYEYIEQPILRFKNRYKVQKLAPIR